MYNIGQILPYVIITTYTKRILDKMMETQKNTGTDVITKIKLRDDILPPNMYNIKYFNDDKTPFQFVEATLTQILGVDLNTAKGITLQVHEEGSAIVDKDFTFEVADHLIKIIRLNCEQCNYPLHVEVIEKN